MARTAESLDGVNYPATLLFMDSRRPRLEGVIGAKQAVL